MIKCNALQIQGDVTVKNVQDDLEGIVETGTYSVKQISGRMFELNLRFRTRRGTYCKQIPYFDKRQMNNVVLQ